MHVHRTRDAFPEKGPGPVESGGSCAAALPATTGPPGSEETAPPSPGPPDSPSAVAQASPLPKAGDHFGVYLEPVLRNACQGRLSEVNWFRTDWQRGGALTGYAHYRDHADDALHPVVVKLPVPPHERRWLIHLQPFPNVAPRVYAHGESLNGYDLAWVVMERLPYGPLSSAWGGEEFDLLAHAAGRFYAAAQQVPISGQPHRADWRAVLERARQVAHDGTLPHAQQWNRVLKKARRRLDDWLALWDARPIDGWCHGDLHLANALTRTPPPQGPAILIDFAQTRPGHWLEDAVYLEHLYWARPDRLHGRKPCRMIAQHRKRLGLSVEPNWPQLAQVYRCLLALAAPTLLQQEGDPLHLEAALALLESQV